MGVTKGRVSEIERGKVSDNDVLARYSAALGGRFHQFIYFDGVDRQSRHRITPANSSTAIPSPPNLRVNGPNGHRQPADLQVLVRILACWVRRCWLQRCQVH